MTPPLPVEDEIKRIQTRKKQETARRIERERRLVLETYEKYKHHSAVQRQFQLEYGLDGRDD